VDQVRITPEQSGEHCAVTTGVSHRRGAPIAASRGDDPPSDHKAGGQPAQRDRVFMPPQPTFAVAEPNGRAGRITILACTLAAHVADDFRIRSAPSLIQRSGDVAERAGAVA